MKIYLFRHGQTTFNRDRRFTGWMDPGLTNMGARQARNIARQLQHKKFEVAFFTRLKRSRQTLKEVLKYHPECVRFVEDDRMIERNYGDLNGASHKDFVKRIGKKLVDLEVEGDLITELRGRAKKEAAKFLGEKEFEMIHRGFYIPPPHGESFADVEKRVKLFIIHLKKLMKKEKISVAISAHGNSIRLFRKIMERASVKEAVSWVIPYDKVFVYSVK